LNEVLGERTSIAEGVFSASSVVDLAERLGVEIPICTSVDNILNQGADINQEVINLLKRSFKTETI
jgi:glycerol-3-phosphate dehydrogenase (NAD(P)+)